VWPEFTYPEASACLQAGDSLLLYTDGITDARNRDGEDYGEERLQRLASELPRHYSAEQIVRAVAEEVSRFTGGADQADDITLVALKTR
jgi:sigma-B regulation protein RsbU (phosphoserine phosphatase)